MKMKWEGEVLVTIETELTSDYQGVADDFEDWVLGMPAHFAEGGLSFRIVGAVVSEVPVEVEA